MSVVIIERPYWNVVNMNCTKCGECKNVETHNAKFAYREINKFRGEHEHLKKANT